VPKERLDKFFSYLLLVCVFLGIFIWSTIKQNADADVAQDGAKISFLAVGEGDAALINLPQSKQILIDTGRAGKLMDKLGARMPAFDREIEAVFLSHPDSDHIGGFYELSQSYKIDKVYVSAEKSDSKTYQKVEEVIKQKNIPETVPSQGESIYFGNLRIEVLWSPPEGEFSSNDSSLVLRMGFDKSKALFVGDLEIKGQKSLLMENEDILADLYKVSHHGSAGAHDENFLKKVGAKNAVISVGPNSYGHPTKTVLDGLAGLGMKIFRTDLLGTIDFIPSENGWKKK
jgi:beta-lactamase superfamily II metal-dependent hydrolase